MRITKLILIFLLATAGFSLPAYGVTRTDKNPQFFMPSHSSHTADSPQNKRLKKHLSGTMEHLAGNKQTTLNTKCIRLNLKPAPTDDILATNKVRDEASQKYRQNIVESYSLLPQDLNLILQNEYNSINQETQRMHDIKKNFAAMSPAYRYANFQLPAQISQEMTAVRQEFTNRKKQYTDFINNAPKNKHVSVIISKDPLFFIKSAVGIKGHWNNVTYTSLFDHNNKHVFTYVRKHTDMLENRSIFAAKTTNGRINQIYQNIFNDYIYDLRRIGAGLDITNTVLLRQLSEMTDDYVLMK